MVILPVQQLSSLVQLTTTMQLTAQKIRDWAKASIAVTCFIQRTWFIFNTFF